LEVPSFIVIQQEVEPARLIEALNEVIEVIDPEIAYQEAMAIAHDEDVSEWGNEIEAWLSQHDRAVSLLTLQRAISSRKKFTKSLYNSPLKALSKIEGNKALSSASVSDCSSLSESTSA
jgi:hypothetical protein